MIEMNCLKGIQNPKRIGKLFLVVLLFTAVVMFVSKDYLAKYIQVFKQPSSMRSPWYLEPEMSVNTLEPLATGNLITGTLTPLRSPWNKTLQSRDKATPIRVLQHTSLVNSFKPTTVFSSKNTPTTNSPQNTSTRNSPAITVNTAQNTVAVISTDKMATVSSTQNTVAVISTDNMATVSSTQTTTLKTEKPFIPVLTRLPSMTLTIRLTSTNRLLTFLYCQALRSISIYWSRSLGKVTLILDEESAKDRKFAENLSKHQTSMGINFVFYYEPLPKTVSILTSPLHKNPGYNRQLYSSFLMDTIIDTDIIAWTDTDGTFTTPVTPENIFNGTKLKVKGMNALQHGHIRGWARITKQMLGKSQVSDFMEYFPVYIWKNTITNCRNHIINYMKVKDIDEAFQIVTHTADNISPVNIIMTYAYYFEKHRYDWHINIEHDSINSYNSKYITPGFELQPADMTPDMHVSIHYKYYKDYDHSVNKKAYCAAIKDTSIKRDQRVTNMCQPYLNSVTWLLFKFNTWSTPQFLPAWCKGENPVCKNILDNHFKNVNSSIRNGLYDLDLNRVLAVETAASEMGIICKSYF